MKKFWASTNKSGKIAAGLAIAGALLFILWAVWLSEGDGISNFVATGSCVLAVILFVSGVAVAFSNSGRKEQ